MKWFRSIALILSIICLLSIVGCKRQSDPTIESSDVSSATADLSESSQEVLSSVAEEPVPGEPSVVESKPEPSMAESEPEPEVSSQPEPSSVAQAPSSVAEAPSSQAESSEPELPTIPFTMGISFETGYFSPPLDKFEATLIHNAEELAQSVLEGLVGDSDKTYLEQCDDVFFKEYVLIEIRIPHSSGSMYDEFNFITRSGNQLIVNWSLMPFDGPPLKDGDAYVMTGDMETGIHLLQVKKLDIEGITEIIGQRSSQAE